LDVNFEMIVSELFVGIALDVYLMMWSAVLRKASMLFLK